MDMNRAGPEDTGRHADSAEARAERVLADYLRQLGLRDPSVIAAHCRSWVRRAAEMSSNQPDEDFVRTALRTAIDDTERWLNHLAQLVAPDPAEAAATRGLLAIEVRVVIDRYPEAFLCHDPLPPGLLREVRAAARPVVPVAVKPARMDGPPLGQLPALFQAHGWRRLLRRLTKTLGVIVGHGRRHM